MTTTSVQDIRWQQRLDNFQRALQQLEEAVLLGRERPLSRLEQQGLIKAFEFTHELAWNVLKDYFEYQGENRLTGSRDAIRLAFQRGLIVDGETWMETIASRNRSAHTYNLQTASYLVERIMGSYCGLFRQLATKMQQQIGDERH